jgi:ribosome biogenesis GTPase
MENLRYIGFDDWFQERVEKAKLAQHDIARVVSVHKDSYMITKGQGDVFAELTGKLAYTADSAADLPTTGDWVYVDFYDDDTHAIIHDIFPRKTIIQRKTSGKTFNLQLIATNIDTAFIVQSLDYNFNLRRLERYLVMVNEANIKPVILLSKCDLISDDEVEQKIESVKDISPKITVLPFSNESGENIEKIKAFLEPGHTYCLLGSSGVGKTTLLNSILGDARFETKTVSKKESKGRHTTTSRELIQLENGAMIIDTPGMRELGNISVDSGLDETFSDIIELAMNCKFSNCTHVNEKGCAILSAISQGALSEKRYQNYLKMKNEAAFNDMSYFEKRQKDKNFGKMIKSVIKSKNR